MTDKRTLKLADIGEDIETFSREFPFRTKAGEDTNAVVDIEFMTPGIEAGKRFAEVRQGKITSKGRLKKLPNDLETGLAAVKACVPDLRVWSDQKLWSLIQRTGGLVSDAGLVQFCYELLGIEREDEVDVGEEGPTANDFPSSSSSTSEDGSAQ